MQSYLQEEKMKPLSWMTAFILVSLVFIPAGALWAAGFSLNVGEPLSGLSLPVPEDPGARKYLGLSGSGTFSPAEVDSPVILVQIFSMYCPHCQRDAGNANAFFRLVEENPGLRGKVKILGVGAGNSPYEVQVFRETYNVPFPLFSDGNYEIHKKVGEVRTPFFIGLKKDDKGFSRIFFTRTGGIDKAEDFLAFLIRESGLEVKP